MGEESGSNRGLLDSFRETNEKSLRIRRQQQKIAQTYGQTESHQFEVDENEVWRHHQLQRHFEDKGRWWTFSKYREVKRWGLTFFTGFWIGVIALFVSYFTKVLTRYKFEVFNGLIEQEKGDAMRLVQLLHF